MANPKSDIIRSHALEMKKLLREAEALADEAALAFARLRQSMLAARQNPAVPVSTGQAALVRLNKAETALLSASSELFRVHDQLNQVAPTVGLGDEEIPTVLEPGALSADRIVADLGTPQPEAA